jgi:hypothetical protein
VSQYLQILVRKRASLGMETSLPFGGSGLYLEVSYSLSATEISRATTVSKSFVTKLADGGEVGDIERQSTPDAFKIDSKSEMVPLPNERDRANENILMVEVRMKFQKDYEKIL